MFSENANIPAKLIKDFSKKHKKPVLKAAYVEESVYMGDDQLEALIAVKSKNELIADVVALLQSPMKTCFRHCNQVEILFTVFLIH